MRAGRNACRPRTDCGGRAAADEGLRLTAAIVPVNIIAIAATVILRRAICAGALFALLIGSAGDNVLCARTVRQALGHCRARAVAGQFAGATREIVHDVGSRGQCVNFHVHGRDQNLVIVTKDKRVDDLIDRKGPPHGSTGRIQDL